MYEGANFNLGGPDFSDLAPKPPKTPEVKKSEDDDIEEDKEKPKTLLEILKKNVDDKKEDTKTPEKDSEKSNKLDIEADDSESGLEDDENGPIDDGELDTDTPEMSAEEEQEVTSAILESRNEEIHDEADNAKTSEAKDEAIAAGIFVEATKQAIDEGIAVDDAIETGKAIAFEVLEIDESKAEPEPSPGSEPEPKTEVETEPTIPSPEKSNPAETDPDLNEEDPENTSTGSGTGASVPPTPPVPPIHPTPMGGSTPNGRVNLSPAAANINSTKDSEDEPGNRIRTGRYLLAGGIVGYLIGKRRGRIKTEKRLLPVQRKLEKEVAGLHGKIAWHEASVRAIVQEQIVKKSESIKTKEVQQSSTEIQKTEQNRSQKAQERDSKQLGKFGLAGERSVQEESFHIPEKLKTVDLMTIPELLVLAEKIEIEQSTVKKLYETNRLDYEGLRRIVRAYLRGERLDKIVRENLLTPEKYAYPETLKSGISSATQPGGGGTADQGSPTYEKSYEFRNNHDASGSPVFQPPLSTVDKKTKIMNPQKYGVIVGIIVAIILLIFYILS